MTDDIITNDKLRARGAALLAEARARAAEVQRALSSVAGDASVRAQLETAGADLFAVEQSLTLALSASTFPLRGSDLTQLGGIISAPSITAIVAEATAKAGVTAQQAQELAAAGIATSATVSQLNDDLFTRHIFDSYLHFSSAEDEEAYHQHEAERQRYIAEQQAKKTPQGDLNAAGAEAGQMLDAHAHGAGDSPEWQPRWDKLAQTIERQRAAMKAAGQSTEEYDRNIRNDVRRFLKDEQHLTDAEIDARLAGAADPLDVVKPYLKTARDTRALEENLTASASTPVSESDMHKDALTPGAPLSTDTTPSNDIAPQPLSLNAVTAKLKAAGVLAADGDNATGHGLTVQDPGTNVSRAGQTPS